MDAIVDPLEVGVQDIVPVFLGHPPHELVPGDSGIVDQDVQPLSKGGEDFAENLVDLLGVPDVAAIAGDHGFGHLALFGHLLGGGLCAFPAASQEGDAGALLQEGLHDGPSNAPGAPGDHGVLPFKHSHFLVLLLCSFAVTGSTGPWTGRGNFAGCAA